MCSSRDRNGDWSPRGTVTYPTVLYPAALAAMGDLGLGLRGARRPSEGGMTIFSKTRVTLEKARRILQAAAVEANGRPGAYVVRDLVMRRANVSDEDDFREIAGYLDRKGWVAAADDDYGVFVLTPEGIDEATR